MEQKPEHVTSPVSRTQILFRLLYTVLFLFVLGFVFFLVKLATFFQYLMLLITLSPIEPVRRFANQLSAYAYHLIRYLTLNDNERPFPFSEFPQEMAPSVGEVRFD